MGKHFVIAVKSNRTVAVSYEAKRQGTFSRLDALNLPERQAIARLLLRGLWTLRFLSCAKSLQVKDGSTGVLYLACSDLESDGEGMVAIYLKRWNVETFHKTLKSHASLAKSPTRTVRTQSNILLPGDLRRVPLDMLLSVTHGLNHVARAYDTALSQGRASCLQDELQLLKAA